VGSGFHILTALIDSLASVNTLFYPLTVLFLWYGLGGYKAAVIEAESADWSMDRKAPQN